jgi:sterol desaturase/sphingolipid hydroxylase (fatty acid hydroxylase superfamily)
MFVGAPPTRFARRVQPLYPALCVTFVCVGLHADSLTSIRLTSNHAYAHDLHHKYFEVNYGGDGLIPLDKWFGHWHDGSIEGEARMNARFEKKKERMNAKAART